jgi:hypothetical protein
MKTHRNITSLGIVALGILTGVLTGCGDESADGTNDEATGTQAASIVARGIAFDGCGANGVFDIFTSRDASNRNSRLDFVALDQSDFSNLTSQLSSFNSQNQQSLVSNNATTLDELLQVAINEATSNTSAFQESQNSLRQEVSSDRATHVSRTRSHQDASEATTDVSSSQWSRNSGSSENRAIRSSRNSLANSADRNSRSGNFFENARSVVRGGDIVGLPGFALGIGVSRVPISSIFNNNSAFNDQNASSSVSNFADNFSLVASSNNQDFANFTASSRDAHTAQASANEWTRTMSADTRDSLDSLAESSAAQNSRSEASRRRFNKNVAQSERSTYVAFQDLQQIDSNHYVLNVNLASQDNQNHTLRIFQGDNNNVRAFQNFNFRMNGCR